jgi:hypothetical protein
MKKLAHRRHRVGDADGVHVQVGDHAQTVQARCQNTVVFEVVE